MTFLAIFEGEYVIDVLRQQGQWPYFLNDYSMHDRQYILVQHEL